MGIHIPKSEITTFHKETHFSTLFTCIYTIHLKRNIYIHYTWMMLHVHAHTGTDDDNHIVLKPTDTFKGERFINACYIDVSSNKQRYVLILI